MTWHVGQEVWDIYYGIKGTITKIHEPGKATHPVYVEYPGFGEIYYLANGKTTDSRIRVLYPIEVKEVTITQNDR